MNNIYKRILIGVISPTWLLADVMKFQCIDKNNKTKRANLIKNYNWIYLIISISSASVIAILQITNIVSDNLYESINYVLIIIIFGYFLSRCNEIFIAFLIDAIEKLDENGSTKSNLTYSERIMLSLRSYLELIFNFAIIYIIFPSSWWKGSNNPKSILESVYFSGVTITTLGYGDITAKNIIPQLLTVYEVFCGFTLLIVCFTIYTNRTNTNSK